MNTTQPDLLSTLFGYWKEVAENTVRCLGDEKANLFVYLFSDALDILRAILDSYSDEDRLHSLVFTEFTGLFNELAAFHGLFLTGKYRLVQSQLRFNWERIFRAWHADAHFSENAAPPDGSKPMLDDKHNWLTQQEDNLNAGTVIYPILGRLFTATDPKAIKAHFKPLWDRLNRFVHPSGDLRERLAGDTALHLRDAFDEPWARETLGDAAEVFALLWLAILVRFLAVIPTLLANPDTFRVCPKLRTALEAQLANPAP